MEPFGLFNLLKTLLPSTNETADSAPQNPPQPPPKTASVPTETPPPPPPHNACLDFMAKHDERARNTKKK